MAGRGTVVVIGLGRFGTAVAAGLARRGTDVFAIDIDEVVVQRLADDLMQMVCADGTDAVALQQLDVPAAGQAVVTIGSLENSMLCTLALAQLQIPQIWATAGGTAHATILRRLGAHRILMPTHDAARQTAQHLAGHQIRYSGTGFAATATRITPQTAAALARTSVAPGAVAAVKHGNDIRLWQPGDALPPHGTFLIAGPPGSVHDLTDGGEQ